MESGLKPLITCQGGVGVVVEDILHRSIDAIKDEERVQGEFNEMALKALQKED